MRKHSDLAMVIFWRTMIILGNPTPTVRCDNKFIAGELKDYYGAALHLRPRGVDQNNNANKQSAHLPAILSRRTHLGRLSLQSSFRPRSTREGGFECNGLITEVTRATLSA
jgi:hypothetical protein